MSYTKTVYVIADASGAAKKIIVSDWLKGVDTKGKVKDVSKLKDVDDSNLGLKGSPTKIARASDKVRKGAGEVVTLDPTEAAQYIVDKFKEKHVI